MISYPEFNRRGSAPRSALVLAAVLVVALAVLFFLRSRDEGPDLTLGGPLFSISASEIDGVLVTKNGVQYRFDQSDEGYWSLSGGISDFVDQVIMDKFLESLASATGGRLLPGSQPEDRRYDFNGQGSLRVTVMAADGRSEKLAIGAKNPVSGFFYGSGAGRQACFPVSPGLREILTAVPSNLQLKTQLPSFPRGAVTQVDLWRGKNKVSLEQWDGRWWMAMPVQGPSVLGTWFQEYSQFYANRQMEKDGQVWLRASDREVGALVYDVSQVVIANFTRPEDAANLADQFGWDEPWRRVVLHGKNINPDTRTESPDQLEMIYSVPLDEKTYPALRRGNLVYVEPEAFTTMAQPPSHFLDSRALDILPSHADSLALRREGKLLLLAHRDRGAAQPGERKKERPVDFWLTDFPTAEELGIAGRSYHARSQNFLINLERTSTLAVLPPTNDLRVLKDAERITLQLWYAGESTNIEVGYLNPDYLPKGSPPLASTDDGMAPVAIWRPHSGQLIQIPGTMITTARAWSR